MRQSTNLSLNDNPTMYASSFYKTPVNISGSDTKKSPFGLISESMKNLDTLLSSATSKLSSDTDGTSATVSTGTANSTKKTN